MQNLLHQLNKQVDNLKLNYLELEAILRFAASFSFIITEKSSNTSKINDIRHAYEHPDRTEESNEGSKLWEEGKQLRYLHHNKKLYQRNLISVCSKLVDFYNDDEVQNNHEEVSFATNVEDHKKYITLNEIDIGLEACELYLSQKSYDLLKIDDNKFKYPLDDLQKKIILEYAITTTTCNVYSLIGQPAPQKIKILRNKSYSHWDPTTQHFYLMKHDNDTHPIILYCPQMDAEDVQLIKNCLEEIKNS